MSNMEANHKTILCDFWEKGNCKYMERSELCKYAHGIEDLYIVYCKYGINCNNPKCLFYHGKSTTRNMVYDIPIINKKKNKKCKKIKSIENSHFCKSITNKEIVINNSNNRNIPLKEYIKDETQIVDIINKNKGIKDTITAFNTDINKILSVVDEFYIKKYNNMVYNKDIIINKLKSENISLKKITKELKIDNKNISAELSKNKINTMNVVENDNIKLKNLYYKYIELYKIFNNNNYKTINLEEIKKYTMDKNIYKVKQRAYKVYNFYQKYINGIIKDVLPISKIIKMSF